jgi:hypothetical protein
MCLLPPIALLLKQLVDEKQRKLGFAMRMAGLPRRTQLLSWWLYAHAEFSLIALLLTLTTMGFMTRTSPLVLFLLLAAFCYGAVAFAFLLSTLFASAILAACAGPVAFVAAVLPQYLFLSHTDGESDAHARFLASFFLPAAFGFGAEVRAIPPPANLPTATAHTACVHAAGRAACIHSLMVPL